MPDLVAIRSILKAGLEWLYDTVQPPGAILQHHGVSSPRVGDLWFGFTPTGWQWHPVVTVNVTRPRRHSDTGELLNPLDQAEMDTVADTLGSLRLDVIAGWWNGAGFDTGSFGLSKTAHPSLVATVDRYRAGCAEHPFKSVFCTCGWYQQGNALLVSPMWPAADETWKCSRCGSLRWVAASLTGPVDYGGRAIRQCVPCGFYSTDAAVSDG